PPDPAAPAVQRVRQGRARLPGRRPAARRAARPRARRRRGQGGRERGAAVTGSRHEFAVQSSKDVYVGKVMALRADEVVMPGGGTAVREIVEHPGAVAVAALDADDRIMMVHQYRHALRRRLWELPAGLLDV